MNRGFQRMTGRSTQNHARQSQAVGHPAVRRGEGQKSGNGLKHLESIYLTCALRRATMHAPDKSNREDCERLMLERKVPSQGRSLLAALRTAASLFFPVSFRIVLSFAFGENC
jgi:hypothetical protein